MDRETRHRLGPVSMVHISSARRRICYEFNLATYNIVQKSLAIGLMLGNVGPLELTKHVGQVKRDNNGHAKMEQLTNVLNVTKNDPFLVVSLIAPKK